MLRIHCFQHVHYEGLGCIAQWCKTNNHPVTYTHFYEESSIPEIDSYDWLIVMGGPMGIYDEKEFPWLKLEKQAIRKAIDADKTVVGICLGAQLIADVLGEKVYRNKQKEIGWHNISLTSEGLSSPIFSSFEPMFKVLHWHGDMFDIPGNAIHLAKSAACQNQAYFFGEKILGLQFHFEVTIESLTQMIKYGRNSLIPAPFVQSEREILDQTDSISDNNNKMHQILDFLSGKTI